MEIKKILIANRGEVALRVIRTCREMGIKTVALCPVKGQEEDFLETQLADEFYYLEKEGVLGYLDQKRILDIAKKSGADALHPGYGFLAENGDFADLCNQNGIKFIGPSGNIIRSLGDKLEAKRIAKKCGLPILMSTSNAVTNIKDCERMTKEIGLPCLLKAVDGGGGIGIEIIDKANSRNLPAIFEKLQRVATSAFGSGRIFIEEFLQNPRHIEFQIIGDGRGNVIHLNERECSIQRRHQKLIEEAPSPYLDRWLRGRMGEAAVKLAKFLKYEGVGTVEFLVDQRKRFYFGEVNPRLQVEHPITEAITGVDLVEQQIRIAQGEKLKLKQWDVRMQGWAMEFRICAENVFENFKPQSGTISRYLVPGGRGIEIHSFCQPGQRIYPFFDSMISKLIVSGKDRQSVIKKAVGALDEYVIEGIHNNIPFHKAVLSKSSFMEGRLSTSFIEKEKILDRVKERYQPAKKKKRGRKEVLHSEELAQILASVYSGMEKNGAKSREENKWRMIQRYKLFE